MDDAEIRDWLRQCYPPLEEWPDNDARWATIDPSPYRWGFADELVRLRDPVEMQKRWDEMNDPPQKECLMCGPITDKIWIHLMSDQHARNVVEKEKNV